MPPLPPMDDSELVRRFSSHQPESWQIQAMEEVRTSCLDLARMVTRTVPPGREQMMALTKIEEFMFIANAGIARPQPKPAEPG